MSTFDIFLLMIILASAVFGLFRGLFKEVFSLVILIGAYFVATYFAPSLSGALASEVGTGTLGYGVSFGMLFLGTLLVGGIINFLVGKVLSSSGLSGIDRVFGFGFGALRVPRRVSFRAPISGQIPKSPQCFSPTKMWRSTGLGVQARP